MTARPFPGTHGLPSVGSFSRREFLAASGAILSAGLLEADNPHVTPPSRPKPASQKIAVVTTAYHYLSHAYHVCGRFLNGYLRDGKFYYPDFAIAGMYVEQQKANDLSRELAQIHGFTLAGSVLDALTLGKDTLAVDGVLLIGEHGDYPYNARLQKLYPRYELFQKIVEVFRKTGKSVPVFCDKHLSYDRTKAAEMVATSRKLGFPLMAGSSLPITWRKPELELPLGVKLEHALVATRGEIEIYGFHGLEALQCMVERRTGAETGVRAVTCLEGDAAWKAGDDGVWSWDLLDEAVSRTPSRNCGDIRENCRQFRPSAGRPTYLKGPIAFVIEYRDGFRATVLIINGHIDDTIFAGKIAGQKKPVSTLFFLPPPPGAAFLEALAIRIEDFLNSGKPPYPVERTQLTGGILDCLLESRQKGHVRLETPDLEIKYEPPRDSGYMHGEYR